MRRFVCTATNCVYVCTLVARYSVDVRAATKIENEIEIYAEFNNKKNRLFSQLFTWTMILCVSVYTSGDCIRPAFDWFTTFRSRIASAVRLSLPRCTRYRTAKQKHFDFSIIFFVSFSRQLLSEQNARDDDNGDGDENLIFCYINCTHTTRIEPKITLAVLDTNNN